MSRYLCTASRLCTRSKAVWRQGTAQMWNECWGGLWILWWEPICEQKYKSEWMLKVLTKHNLPPTSWSCIPVLHNSRLLSHQLFFVHQPSQVPQSTIHYSLASPLWAGQYWWIYPEGQAKGRPILPSRRHYCLAGSQAHHYTLKSNVA